VGGPLKAEGVTIEPDMRRAFAGRGRGAEGLDGMGRTIEALNARRPWALTVVGVVRVAHHEGPDGLSLSSLGARPRAIDPEGVRWPWAGSRASPWGR
jgi:hypothetical protein